MYGENLICWEANQSLSYKGEENSFELQHFVARTQNKYLEKLILIYPGHDLATIYATCWILFQRENRGS